MKFVNEPQSTASKITQKCFPKISPVIIAAEIDTVIYEHHFTALTQV